MFFPAQIPSFIRRFAIDSRKVMVVRQRDIPDLDILVAPLVEELDAANLRRDLLGQDGNLVLGLDLDFAV